VSASIGSVLASRPAALAKQPIRFGSTILTSTPAARRLSA
jgi:hypothetical protein